MRPSDFQYRTPLASEMLSKIQGHEKIIARLGEWYPKYGSRRFESRPLYGPPMEIGF